MALAIPEGEDRLPPGRHQATVDEVKAALVDPFATSTTRAPLFDRWLLVREAIARIVPIETEWINGSFVTSKTDPKDIDVVTHLEAEAYEGLDDVHKVTLAGLLGGHDSVPLHGCDSFPLVAYSTPHPAAVAYQMASQYWDNLWGTHRDGAPKGYVEVIA